MCEVHGSSELLSRCLEPEVDPEPEAEVEPEVDQKATYRARGDLLSQVEFFSPSSPPIMVYNMFCVLVDGHSVAMLPNNTLPKAHKTQFEKR